MNESINQSHIKQKTEKRQPEIRSTK